MLSFLSPLFLAGAAAAALPVVLHLLKREPEARVKFAAVRLLRHAPVEHTKSRHLREILLLALRVAALLLLAFAFARPFLPSGAAAASGGVTIVALDTSASLSAPGQFDRAKQRAKNAIAQAPAGDLVGVVTFADSADIAAKPTTDRVLAGSAIDQAVVGFGGTRYRAAVSASTQALAGRPGTIVVVTDLQESGWDAGDRVSVPADARIVVEDIGAIPENLAITAVRPLADRVSVTVFNARSRAREARVHLTIDDRPAGETMVSLGPNQSGEALFGGTPKGGAAAASVDDPGGVPADNVRYAVLGGMARPSVLVVTGTGDLPREAFYVQHALATGAGALPGFQPVGGSGAQLSSGGRDLSAQAAVLLLSTRGLERRGREALALYVTSGGGIVIAAGPDLDGDVAADVLGDASTVRLAAGAELRADSLTLAPVDRRHPVFEIFGANAASLGLVKFRRTARIVASACQTLARFTTGDSAVAECPAGEGRALIVASDFDNRWNDFPLHATFVPFLHELVQYVASARGHASDYLIGDVPAGVPRKPGIATLGGGRPGAAPRRIAVNVDPRESELARISADDFRSAVTRMKDVDVSAARVEARQREDRQHLWLYALAAMVVTLAVEGMVAARTA